MADTILVVGGTGMLGEPVARQLAVAGKRVRVMSRKPEQARAKFAENFEIAPGDVEDAPSLAQAIQGCAGVHINLEGQGDWDLERRGAEAVSVAARNAGVQRITLITGASTCEKNAWFPMTRAKFEAENAVRASGVAFSIFRCTMFMELLPKFVRDGKALVMGDQPTPWHWVAAADYAAMVAKAHDTEAAAGKTFYVYGPEALTMEQAIERYRALCAPQAQLVRVPFWVLWLMARLPARRELRRVGLPSMRYFSKVHEIGDASEANALLGAPSTTLEAFCRTRAAQRAVPERPTR